MQAVVVHETGGRDVLRPEQTEPPQAGEGEVLVRVHAASVNPIDWKFRSGRVPKQLPAILGSDISGVVEESHADGLAPEEEVFGIAASGAYAQQARCLARMIAIKPAGISHEQAAALPVAAMTAWQALFDHGGLQRGQTALIAGASGGVGHLAVQFASHAGAHTIALGSTHNREFVLGLGAADYVDYTSEDVAQGVSGVDVAFDAVGGETTAALLATVHEGGVLVTIANAAPEDQARERGARAVQFSMSPDPAQLAAIAAMVAANEVHIEIAAQLPLSEVARAHELSESGRTRGKIVLTVPG
jgi:NADPH:quinone reductase-like Zn-dependent oxidoreductase